MEVDVAFSKNSLYTLSQEGQPDDTQLQAAWRNLVWITFCNTRSSIPAVIGLKEAECITSQDNMLYYTAYMPAHAASGAARRAITRTAMSSACVCILCARTRTSTPASIYLSMSINSSCATAKVASMFQTASWMLADRLRYEDGILSRSVRARTRAVSYVTPEYM